MRPRSWLPHVVLVLAGMATFAVARVQHLSTAEALRIAQDRDAPTADRIWAAHIAANRATERDPELGVDLTADLLTSEDERLREYALTIDLCRHAILPPTAPMAASPPLQSSYAYGPLPPGGWTGHRIRSLILYRRKVGGSRVGGVRRMELDEVRWFTDSLDGGPPPSVEEVRGYFSARDLQPAPSPRDH